jgi:hypothetical protein
MHEGLFHFSLQLAVRPATIVAYSGFERSKGDIGKQENGLE